MITNRKTFPKEQLYSSLQVTMFFLDSSVMKTVSNFSLSYWKFSAATACWEVSIKVGLITITFPYILLESLGFNILDIHAHACNKSFTSLASATFSLFQSSPLSMVHVMFTPVLLQCFLDFLLHILTVATAPSSPSFLQNGFNPHVTFIKFVFLIWRTRIPG